MNNHMKLLLWAIGLTIITLFFVSNSWGGLGTFFTLEDERRSTLGEVSTVPTNYLSFRLGLVFALFIFVWMNTVVASSKPLLGLFAALLLVVAAGWFVAAIWGWQTESFDVAENENVRHVLISSLTLGFATLAAASWTIHIRLQEGEL